MHASVPGSLDFLRAELAVVEVVLLLVERTTRFALPSPAKMDLRLLLLELLRRPRSVAAGTRSAEAGSSRAAGAGAEAAGVASSVPAVAADIIVVEAAAAAAATAGLGARHELVELLCRRNLRTAGEHMVVRSCIDAAE